MPNKQNEVKRAIHDLNMLFSIDLLSDLTEDLNEQFFEEILKEQLRVTLDQKDFQKLVGQIQLMGRLSLSIDEVFNCVVAGSSEVKCKQSKSTSSRSRCWSGAGYREAQV